MPQKVNRKNSVRPLRSALSTISVRKNKEKKVSSMSFLEKIQGGANSNQSYVNLVLGLLVVLVAGILIFNYFKKDQSNLGPAQQTDTAEAPKDVEPENLPGKYTVKEGDTLFTIAQNYYKDGYKFSEIAKANNLANVDLVEVGQILEIPKLEEPKEILAENDLGTGGEINSTIWGEKITGDTYTVVEGDWLSKIAGRAYGDIMAYEKIAQANNISNPDLIEPGTVLKIPR